MDLTAEQEALPPGQRQLAVPLLVRGSAIFPTDNGDELLSTVWDVALEIATANGIEPMDVEFQELYNRTREAADDLAEVAEFLAALASTTIHDWVNEGMIGLVVGSADELPAAKARAHVLAASLGGMLAISALMLSASTKAGLPLADGFEHGPPLQVPVRLAEPVTA